MAKLNKVMGAAHVEAENTCEIWYGYINLVPDPAILAHYDIFGPSEDWFYEGPVNIDGKYFMAKGNVLIKKVDFKQSPSELRVEFTGNGKLNLLWPLTTTPFDYTN